jgi:hypothetical protein
VLYQGLSFCYDLLELVRFKSRHEVPFIFSPKPKRGTASIHVKSMLRWQIYGACLDSEATVSLNLIGSDKVENKTKKNTLY